MRLEFKRLGEINCLDYVALNTNPLVRRQMPLTSDKFDEEACRQWIAGKEKMWEQHGYGPWAFGEMGLQSVTILFPPARTRIKGILRLGFKPDGEVEIGGEKFIRYRLYAPQTQERSSE